MQVRLCTLTLSVALLIPFNGVAQQVEEALAPPPSAEAAAPPAADPQAGNEAAEVTAAASPPAAAPETVASNGRIAPAPADKAQIVFFRPNKFVGGAVGFKVREGEQELGKLRSGNYFIHFAEPGTHHYTVHSEAKDVLTMEVEEGETYFVQGTITMGVLAGRPNLSPSDEATFNGMADKLKLRE